MCSLVSHFAIYRELFVRILASGYREIRVIRRTRAHISVSVASARSGEPRIHAFENTLMQMGSVSDEVFEVRHESLLKFSHRSCASGQNHDVVPVHACHVSAKRVPCKYRRPSVRVFRCVL